MIKEVDKGRAWMREWNGKGNEGVGGQRKRRKGNEEKEARKVAHAATLTV